MSLPPATLPPEYLPLKRKLMGERKDEFASFRKEDVRLRLFEIVTFLFVWLGGATLTLFGASLSTLWLKVPLMALGIFLCGLALFVFFLEVHEGMHSLLFKNKLLNDLVSFLFCLPLFMSLTGAVILHLRHHRYLGEKGDPDEYRFYAKTKLGLMLLYYGRMFIAPTIYIFLIPVLGYRHATSRQRRRIFLEFAVMLIFYFIIFSHIPLMTLLFIWLIPSFVAGFLVGLWGLAQHAFTNASDPLLASRSIHASPLVSFCFINQNYHFEHHLFPEVPSYHLKKVYEVTWGQLPYALYSDSYIGFLREFIRLSFKLEDKPIGYTEIIGW
ncbi:MAG: fatty acid desaturase [Anaerolineales bacterium]|nr:fatty acid desaturase [Anaerolineales bacterium]